MKSEFFYHPATTIDQLNREYALASLTFFEGNKFHAAAALGITVKTLYNWLNRWGVPLNGPFIVPDNSEGTVTIRVLKDDKGELNALLPGYHNPTIGGNG